MNCGRLNAVFRLNNIVCMVNKTGDSVVQKHRRNIILWWWPHARKRTKTTLSAVCRKGTEWREPKNRLSSSVLAAKGIDNVGGVLPQQPFGVFLFTNPILLLFFIALAVCWACCLGE